MPDLSILYFVDLENGEVVPYRNEQIPSIVSPIIETDRQFSFTMSNIDVSDEDCAFFMMEHKQNQEVNLAPLFDNREYTVSVDLPAKYYLFVHAYDFKTCSASITGNGQTVSISVDFSKLPSDYEYIEKYKYECGENEFCLRDPEGSEVNVTKWLEIGCPAEVILNGDAACKDWFIVKQAEEINALSESQENANPDLVDVRAAQQETNAQISGLLSAVQNLAQSKDNDNTALLFGLGALAVIGLGAYFVKRRNVRLGPVFPSLMPKKPLYDNSGDMANQIFEQGDETEVAPVKKEKPMPEKKEEPEKEKPQGIPAYDEWDDSLEEIFTENEIDEDAIDVEEMDLGEEEKE